MFFSSWRKGKTGAARASAPVVRRISTPITAELYERCRAEVDRIMRVWNASGSNGRVPVMFAAVNIRLAEMGVTEAQYIQGYFDHKRAHRAPAPVVAVPEE